MDMEEFPPFFFFLKISNMVWEISQVDTAWRNTLFTYLPHHLSPQITTAAVLQIIRAVVQEYCGMLAI